MATSSTSRTRAFISYSHKDAKFLKELQVQLNYLERSGVVDYWDDSKLEPGSDWFAEIHKAMDSAKVAILLVSPDFLASDFIANEELPKLLTASKQEGAIILLIILNFCVFSSTPLVRYQTINSPDRPLSTMNRGERAKVWVRVAELVKDSLQGTQQETHSATGTPQLDQRLGTSTSTPALGEMQGKLLDPQQIGQHAGIHPEEYSKPENTVAPLPDKVSQKQNNIDFSTDQQTTSYLDSATDSGKPQQNLAEAQGEMHTSSPTPEGNQLNSAYTMVLPKHSGAIKKWSLITLASSLIGIILVAGLLNTTFFKSGNTITQHHGTPTPSPTMSLPTSTISSTNLNPNPINRLLTDVDYQGLLNDDPAVIAHLQQEMRATPGLEGNRAGLVETFGGSPSGNPSLGQEIAQKFERDVLQGLGQQGFVFISPVYQNFSDLSSPPTTVVCQIFVYK